jgi:quercetin dioxygenase-like cupin family protein
MPDNLSEITRPEPQHRDARGAITDLLVNERIDAITLITSAKGAVRGHHYHKETVQWLYVLKGALRLLTQMPDAPVVASTVSRGDLVATYPPERHAFIALEDSEFMVFTRGPRSGRDYEVDTYRLAEPLRE